MTSKEENLRKLEAEYCSWGDTVHYSKHPKIFKRSEGVYLYDDAGLPYLDLQMWYSTVNFGYRNPKLIEALKEQIDTMPQLACQYLHEEKIYLAQKIAQSIEKAFGVKGRVHFNVGGASANEDALKIVRNHTGKNSVFAFMGSYHGRTLGATSITSSYRYREHYGHFGDRANFIPYPYQFRCSESGCKQGGCTGACLGRFDKLFESEYYSVVNPKNNNCEYGAFFVEPVQGTGGTIIPPKDYFKGLTKTLQKHNVLLVDDEVKMGFFRTGKMWAMEHFGVTPDVISFGKSMTNGLNPISGIWAREDLISPEVFPPGSTHSTFSSNPLGTATALAVMNLIEESDLAVTVPQKGARFLKHMLRLKAQYSVIGDVNALGLALRFEICEKDGFTPNRTLTEIVANIGLEGKLNARGQKMGLILDIGGYYKNVFTLAPSLFITDEEIDLSMELFEQALQQGLVKSQ